VHAASASPRSKGAVHAGASAGEKPATSTQVRLRERKLFVHLDAEEEQDAKSWVLDTGAANHMSC